MTFFYTDFFLVPLTWKYVQAALLGPTNDKDLKGSGSKILVKVIKWLTCSLQKWECSLTLLSAQQRVENM